GPYGHCVEEAGAHGTAGLRMVPGRACTAEGSAGTSGNHCIDCGGARTSSFKGGLKRMRVHGSVAIYGCVAGGRRQGLQICKIFSVVHTQNGFRGGGGGAVQNIEICHYPAGKKMIVYCVQPLGAFRVPAAHFVPPAPWASN